MATLKLTGIDDAMANFVSERTKAMHFTAQAEYLRSLIREDMMRAEKERRSRISEILGPVHQYSDEKGIDEARISDVIESARQAVFQKKI